MERCPAKSPLWYFYKIFQDKQKKSNTRIKMYGNYKFSAL